MLRFDYGYKHIKLKINSLEVIIELSYDNTMEKPVFCAKSNLLFQDEFGDWGHAVGVGDTEEQALQMCYNELEGYLNLTFDKSIIDNVTIFDIPKRITIEYKKHIIILFVKNDQEHQVILTNQGKIFIEQDVNLIDYLDKNIKLFINKGVENSSDTFFESNEFSPIFDKLSSKYKGTIL